MLPILCYIGNMKNKFLHLAPAPYSVIDYEYKEQGSACDHCGAFIKHVFVVKGSNGVKFQLGSQHVLDVGGTELVKEAKTVRKATEIHNRQQAYIQQKAESDAKRESDYAEVYNKAVTVLASQPHPNSYFANQGKTKLDYLRYFEENNGKKSSRVMSIVYEAVK